MDLRATAEKSIGLMVAGMWDRIPARLLNYLSEELGRDPKNDPVGAALVLLKLGVPPERATSFLNWKEFECFCKRALEMSDFDPLGPIRFSLDGRRYEIDVLGLRGELHLSIDCKMWSQWPKRSSKLRSLAKDHLKRTKAFQIAVARDEVPAVTAREGRGILIPVIMTWLDVGLRIVPPGTPVVPLHTLSDFLERLHQLIDEFEAVELDFTLERRG